jgi:hypothetical protein
MKLVQTEVSTDTVHCLERLLADARAGKVVGIVYGVIFKRRNFSVNACGEAHRSPVFARGVLATLDDELSQRVRGRP